MARPRRLTKQRGREGDGVRLKENLCKCVCEKVRRRRGEKQGAHTHVHV